MAGNIAIFVPHAGCPNRCSFCDQQVISGEARPPTGADVADICRCALARLRDRTGEVEIAFFGGSFTAVNRDYMLELLAAAQPFLDDPRVCGIRVSTRPDAVDAERLALLKQYGVTSVELGAQSMDDDVLIRNKRGHTAVDVVRASAAVQAAGFSLGLQMMTGLYGADEQSDWRTALALADLAPDTVRIYPTVVLAGTGLAALLQSGDYTPPGVEQSLPLLARLLDLFEQRGIRVIRLGLHASPEVEARLLGGCYHPALGELAVGERYFQGMLSVLTTQPPGPYRLRVQPRLLSQVAGQHKRNVTRLARLGYPLTLQADAALTEAAYLIEGRGETD